MVWTALAIAFGYAIDDDKQIIRVHCPLSVRPNWRQPAKTGKGLPLVPTIKFRKRI